MVVHDALARWLDIDIMHNNAALYSQHIRVKNNFIADCLSCDHHLSTKQLTFMFTFLLPEQTPTNFGILTLPNELTL